jgi:hypothetical protein
VILMGFYVEVLVSSELTKKYEIEETVPPKQEHSKQGTESLNIRGVQIGVFP